jgi:hypothetical protein
VADAGAEAAGVVEAAVAAEAGVRIAEVVEVEGDARIAARVEWEEAAGARSAAGLRCPAEVIAEARAIAVVGPEPGRHRGPAETVRAG